VQARERDAKEDEILRKRMSNRKAKSWSMWFRELTVGLARWVDAPPPLPGVLKNSDNLTQSVFEDEVHIRLSEAMAVLMKRSLIMKQNRVDDRYSMHPLVHKWIRERPEMLISHQSLWCQVAMTTLAKSILLPPLDDTVAGRKTRRELLPHIIHVRDCETAIRDRLEENKGLRRSIWPTIQTKYGRLQADESARFSRVYSECGFFDEALHLQLKVRSFVTELLGEDHPLSIRLTLLASGTLWELSRTTEATQLQRRAHQICLDSLGEHHPLTLDVTDLLGSALLLKGRYTEAHFLHKRNVEEMRNLYGEHHEKYFKALRNLGGVHSRWMEYEEASELHQRAWQGMKQCLGDTHLETLACLEDLAMSYVRHDGESYVRIEEHVRKSHERMKFVYEQRRKVLGKEQPYTLLAYFYWAQVKAAIGTQEEAEEAEKMMGEVIATAGINVSEEHTVVLAAKAHHARLLVQLGRCEEGAEILRTLIHKPQYRRTTDEDGDHPDRIAAMWFLSECLEKQGKFQDALDACEGMLVALQGIGGNGRGMNHKFRLMLLRKIDELKIKLGEGT
jgi:tetratricopeptide (TPR) repeat protein